MPETHWKKLTNPNYLGSWDFRQGEERILTISRVVQEEVFNPSDNSKKHCTVAYFLENSKPMVLNKTNCKTIAAIYNTPYIERWSGCLITVAVEKVKAFGKLEDGLRVKNKKPAKSQPIQQELMCADCNLKISNYKNFTAVQIADLSRERYGVNLCADCGSRRKTAESGGVNNVVDK